AIAGPNGHRRGRALGVRAAEPLVREPDARRVQSGALRRGDERAVRQESSREDRRRARACRDARNQRERAMNNDTLKGQWMQVKGKVRERWGKLTNDDLDQIQGQAEQLVGKVQERYGIARDQAKREVDAWLKEDTTVTR